MQLFGCNIPRGAVSDWAPLTVHLNLSGYWTWGWLRQCPGQQVCTTITTGNRFHYLGLTSDPLRSVWIRSIKKVETVSKHKSNERVGHPFINISLKGPLSVSTFLSDLDLGLIAICMHSSCLLIIVYLLAGIQAEYGSKEWPSAL